MTEESVILQCSSCNTKNRVPKSRLEDKPICGKCHSLLYVNSFYDHPVTVTDNTFKKEVLSHRGLILLDCWAPWCGPCRMVGPVVDQLAKEYAGRVKFAKLNVDENPITASQFAIQSIPTLLLFKNGEQVKSLLGALPKAEIEKHLQSYL